MHFCDVADCPKYCWSKVKYGLCVGECISSSPLTAHYCICICNGMGGEFWSVILLKILNMDV